MDKSLFDIVEEVKLEYPTAMSYKVQVTFYPYKNVSHTIRMRNKTLYIRICDKLQNAPYEILKSISVILFDKIFRRKTAQSVRHTYRNYISQFVLPELEIDDRKISGNYTAQGRFFNLKEIFNKVNGQYFNFSIIPPVLGWSLNKSYRRLGFYDHQRNLLVVSKILDGRRVPDYVVEYLMYHEMLHMVHPVKSKNGRRVIHSSQFKNDERNFKEYQAAIKWLKRRYLLSAL
jgi:hypothetical protein